MSPPFRGRAGRCRRTRMAFWGLNEIMGSMGSGYWRVEFIRPAKSGDDRCVLLHGQLDETVGPMTIEMAEAWIDRFDTPATEGTKPAKAATSSAAGAPKIKVPKGESAG